MLNLSSKIPQIFKYSTNFFGSTKDVQQPLIITVALTGNVPTKQMNKNLPVSSEEIAEDVEKCAKLGACVFHVHARDSNEKPTLDLDVYRKTVKLIKERVPDVIIQLSTGGRAGMDPKKRANVVRLCPEMGSFTTGSNNLANIIYTNSPDFVNSLAKTFYDTKVKPEIEVFDNGHLATGIFLAQKRKLVTLPMQIDFVLGTVGGMPGTVKALQHLVDQIPPGSNWTVCGIGPRHQLKLTASGMCMGGNVRIGLEDNIYHTDGSLSSNPDQVEQIVNIAKIIGRPIATPDQARKILGIPMDARYRIDEYLDGTKKLHPVNDPLFKDGEEIKLDEN